MRYLKPLLFVIGGCLPALYAAAQEIIEDEKIEVPADKVFVKVGLEANTNPYAWKKHIESNAKLPDSLLKKIKPGTYTVIVQFIIDKEGHLSEVKAENDPGYGLAARAVRIIKSYKGEWQPAIQCGRLVKSYVKQPVTFIIPT